MSDDLLDCSDMDEAEESYEKALHKANHRITELDAENKRLKAVIQKGIDGYDSADDDLLKMEYAAWCDWATNELMEIDNAD